MHTNIYTYTHLEQGSGHLKWMSTKAKRRDGGCELCTETAFLGRVCDSVTKDQVLLNFHSFT